MKRGDLSIGRGYKFDAAYKYNEFEADIKGHASLRHKGHTCKLRSNTEND